MRYLLDTNAISHALRFPQGDVAVGIEAVGSEAVCTSVVVTSELLFGARKKASDRLARQIGLMLEGLEVLPLQQPADEAYASLRTHLERRGELIGQNDMLIAAHALALDATLVTDNVKEFSRVPGLKIENWLRHAPAA